MNQDFCKELLDDLHDGVYFLDRDRKIIYWNKGAERITGYKSSEVMETHCRDNILIHINNEGVNLCLSSCPVAATISDGVPREMELYLHHKDGYRLPVWVRVTPLRDANGKIVGAVEIFSDNSAKVALLEMIEELKKEAYIDFITGLANRHYSEVCLHNRYREMLRYGWSFGVIFMDLDKFKIVNDQFGHDVGDKVLKMVAQALLKSSRSFDLVGRWSGDEFIAIVLNVNKNRLASIAERFRMLVEQSKIIVGSNSVGVTVSVGAALAEPDESVETLLKKVDRLMYCSKSAGGNRVSLSS